MTWTKARFAITADPEDTGTGVEGYTDGETWKGYSRPVFTREQGLEVVRYLDGVWYDPGSDVFFDSEGAAYSPFRVAGIPEPVYRIADYCLWERVA